MLLHLVPLILPNCLVWTFNGVNRSCQSKKNSADWKCTQYCNQISLFKCLSSSANQMPCIFKSSSEVGMNAYENGYTKLRKTKNVQRFDLLSKVFSFTITNIPAQRTKSFYGWYKLIKILLFFADFKCFLTEVFHSLFFFLSPSTHRKNSHTHILCNKFTDLHTHECERDWER